VTLRNASYQAVEPERRIVRKLKSMLLAAAGLTEAVAGVRRSHAVEFEAHRNTPVRSHYRIGRFRRC
jgi:glycerol-3-phosphate O-acyltransferase